MSISLLQQYMQEHNLSQAKVATALGVSSATISQYLKGNYSGDVSAIDKKVEEMLARARDKKTDINMGFVATDTAKAIFDICGMAHSMNDINLVIGEAGLGKTMALKHYSDSIDNVVLIEAEPTFSPKVLLNELCGKLGVVVSKSNHDNIQAIVGKLQGTEKLIIIDEAELLSYKCLEIVRRIHDLSGVGVVLAGMPQLRANLRGRRGEYKQLYSRIGFAYDLKKALPDADIKLLVQHAIGTDEFDDSFIEASGGNARRLNKILRGVNRIVKLNPDKPLSAKMIERVTDMLIN